MKFSSEYRTNTHDLDLNNIVTASSQLRYMLDSVNQQMEECTPSYDQLFDSGYSFILSRTALKFHLPLYSHDSIRCETWAVDGKGVAFNRCYRIFRGNDLIAEGVSVWALVDMRDRHLLRHGEVELNYHTDEMLTIDAPTRFKIPSECVLTEAGKHKVRYSDVDRNRHMNNTKYADMLLGFIPSMENLRISELVINYSSEAPLGEELTVFHSVYEGKHYFRTLREDGSLNVECLMTIEEIK